MHGAGNDFVLFDDRATNFPVDDPTWIASIAARRTGIGCEGVILLQPSNRATFRMRFFNPDGSEVEMCGNGARCIARLANDIGAAPRTMTIETAAGILQAEAMGDEVRLGMTTPRDWRMNRTLQFGDQSLNYHFVNSGVPHAVVETADLDRCDVRRIGAGIRHHADFAPAGTNADFIRITGPQSLRIRTYERGVEDESGACGTGIVAGALVSAKAGAVKPPVTITTPSGHNLIVDFRLTSTGASNVTLLGPAVHVFHGTVNHP
jgi:diaminopimelate epimerase